MTQVLDRPKTEVDVRTQTEVRPRPYTLDREVEQLPPVGEPPRRNLRWIGWLLGVAVLGLFTWLLISQTTAEDTTTATPTVVVPEGAITADPKVRTEVVTVELITEAARTGIPGTASLTEIVTLGQTPAESLEDTTVSPIIYWATPSTYATMMEEATVSPAIYHTPAPFDIAEYLGIPNFYTVPSVADGAYWRHDVVIAERPILPTQLDLTFGIWPTMYAEPAVATSTALSGAYWRFDQVLDEQVLFPEGLKQSLGFHSTPVISEYTDFGYQPSYWATDMPLVAQPLFTAGVGSTYGDVWPSYYAEAGSLETVSSHGGHMNLKL